ncbi:translocation/assembly module TamB domain-containing protein [Oceanivirga miroungae]|uniref:Translocation and assembly module TamB C-terminal domain-containing protein n=1 Tax=Oceanivirga miroungae TaxID=1130046 RepID=A0A6I8M5C0_9FUSO|nr:hypothetical protein [Oceanivirga miroungae]VWL85118.1 hypothetical protein OMES3154_00400 [Oceanivirga miroungae]
MKKLRYIILMLLVTIFSMLSFIILSNLTLIVNYVFKDIVKANISVGNIELKGFKVIGKNVIVNTLDNKPVAKIENVSFKINPLAITKLKNIKINSGFVLVSMDKNNILNVEKIFKDFENSKLSPKVYTTSISKIELENIDVRYETHEFNDLIELDAYNVNGYMDISKVKDFFIDVNGKVKSPTNEKDGWVRYKYDKLKDVISIEMKDISAKKEIAQFSETDLFYADDYTASGHIDLSFAGKKLLGSNIELNGYANNLKYIDYDEKIKKVYFDMKMKDEKVNLNAKSKIDGKNVEFDLDLVLDKSLDVKLNLEDMSYKKMKKFDLIKKYDIDLESNINFDGKFSFDIIKQDEVNLKDLSIKLDTKKLKYKDYEIKNIFADINSNKQNIKAKLETNVKGYDINSDIYVESNLNLLNKKGNAKVLIENNIDIEKLKKLNIDFEFKGLDDIKAKLYNKYILTDIKYDLVKDVNYLNINLKDGENNLSIIGNTDNLSYLHDYKIKANYDKYNVDLELSGQKYEFNLKPTIKISKFSRDDLYLYNTTIKGNISNILSDDIEVKMNANISELWYKYQRLKDVNLDILYRDNLLKLNNIKNDKLAANLSYDIKNEKLDLDLKLLDYMLYTTNKNIDANLLISNLSLKAKGKLNDLVVESRLDKSDLSINDKHIADLEYDINTIENDIVMNTKLNDKKFFKLEYLKDSKDVKLDLNLEEDLKNFLKIDDASAKIKLNSKLEGKKDSLKGNIDLSIKDIIYKEYKIPNIKLNTDISNVNVFSNELNGIVNIKEFSSYNENENDKIFSLKEKIDLSNLDVDIKLEKRSFDLSNVSERLSGKIEASGIFKLDKNEMYGNISLDSKQIKIEDNKFTNLIFLAQMDKNGFDIGQGYIEYQKNPLLVDGYMLFKPFTYNIRMIAQDFNLDFLKFNKKISESGGIANINASFEPSRFKGDIKVENFLLKTKDLDIKNTNIDVLLLNRLVNIDRLTSNINGGNFSLVGQVEVPKMDKNSITNKKLNLDNINLRMTTNNVDLKYAKNNAVLSSIIDFKKNLISGAIDIHGGNINNIDFINSNKNSKTKSYFVSFIKEILYNTLEDYETKLDIDIVKDININVPNYLVIQKIKGSLNGNLKLNVKKLNPYIIGKLNLVNGSYLFNTNLFNIDRLSIDLDGGSKLNPHIDLISSTLKNNEKINITINSKLEDMKIKLSSSTNKTREELINELTLNTSQKNLGKDLINFATTTAVNQLINTFINPLEKTLGLTKLELNTNNLSIPSLEASRIFKNINANLFIQGKIYKNLYWDFRTSIPFDTSTNPIHYGLGLSYELKGNLNAVLGLDIDTYPNGQKDVGGYLGISYKKDAMYLSEIFKNK